MSEGKALFSKKKKKGKALHFPDQPQWNDQNALDHKEVKWRLPISSELTNTKYLYKRKKQTVKKRKKELL